MKCYQHSLMIIIMKKIISTDWTNMLLTKHINYYQWNMFIFYWSNFSKHLCVICKHHLTWIPRRPYVIREIVYASAKEKITISQDKYTRFKGNKSTDQSSNLGFQLFWYIDFSCKYAAKKLDRTFSGSVLVSICNKIL